MNLVVKKLTLHLIIAVLILSACKQNGDYTKFTHDPFVFSKTVKQLNEVVMQNNFTPPVASRNYAYACIAAYEAMVPGDKRFRSFSGIIKSLPEMPKPDSNKKYDFDFASMLAFCKVGNAVTFPEGSMDEYVNQLHHMADSAGIPDEVLKNSIAFADTIANAVLKWSKKDNYAQTRSATKYTVIDEEGRWIPTPPMYASAIEPHWGEIRMMVMDSTTMEQVKAPKPISYNVKDTNSEYYKELMKLKVSQEHLTKEQAHIADFWDDNPFTLNVSGHVMFATKKFSPPGHWMNICGIGAQKTKADFGTTVYSYAVTSVALFDAFICCWHEKYIYNTVRPETPINKHFDPEWHPHIQTPPFPEYTCGHSTISASAAEILTHTYGDNIAYTDTSETEFGIRPRSFSSFRQAAKENIWARFYGGIHLHKTCEISNDLGAHIGDIVYNKLSAARIDSK